MQTNTNPPDYYEIGFEHGSDPVCYGWTPDELHSAAVANKVFKSDYTDADTAAFIRGVLAARKVIREKSAGRKIGKNLWIEDEYSAPVWAETRPSDYHYPAVNLRRVHGSSYAPYADDGSVWVKFANKALASHAQSNFARGNR